jgi:ATP-dependent Clp protease ATP-binding subunit ClpA
MFLLTPRSFEERASSWLLARGELRTIAATTWAEYKKYFDKDAALARRFQAVKVEESDEDRATRMMRGLCPTLEGHHGVCILDEAVTSSLAAVNGTVEDQGTFQYSLR